MYGAGPIAEPLGDMNGYIILVFFPLDVAPAGACAGLVPAEELHTRRAALDCPVDYNRLPGGPCRVWLRLDRVPRRWLEVLRIRIFA